MQIQSRLSFGKRLAGSPAEVRPLVEAALKAEGFGVLTQIDVQATLRLRLGADTRPYLILGACNPTLAHRALEADPTVGVLLPCNVVLREDGPETIVEVMDPRSALGMIDSPDVRAIAEEARARLERVVEALPGG